MSLPTADLIALDETWSTHNYHPLPVVLAEGAGAWVTDVDGKRYLDFLAGYSALNFGHRHPALVEPASASERCRDPATLCLVSTRARPGARPARPSEV